jgi:hypothetical protein
VKFTVEIHQNPRPPLTTDILHQLAAHNERLIQWAVESKEGLAEYLCGVESTSTWRNEEARRWHKTLASWMPKQALDWWLPWFEIEPTLVPMPLGWLRWRTLALVVIRCRRQIVAMGALTIVIGNGYQGHNDFRGGGTLLRDPWSSRGSPLPWPGTLSPSDQRSRSTSHRARQGANFHGHSEPAATSLDRKAAITDASLPR